MSPTGNVPTDNTIAGIAILVGAGVVTWFWRLVMGHGRRLAALEKDVALTNAHLTNIEKNTDRLANTLEGMSEHHREDIVRAYEKVEAVHLLVIDVLKKGKPKGEGA